MDELAGGTKLPPAFNKQQVMETSIVLGCLFGDEGKGKTVDWLCGHNRNSVVVRFSGGQQCGHTVMNAKGKHIHASFPSGTLAGHTGYISEHCTVSPLHILNEKEVLNDLSVTPNLIVHPLAPITTLYDIWAGRAKSTEDNVGSCGMGVGATMTRHHQSPIKLHFVDILNDFVMEEKLFAIANWYKDKGYFHDRADLDYIRLNWSRFKEAVEYMRKHVFCESYDILRNSPLIFEGSQGIMLDMDHGHFPHVTYANTTSKNAIKICNKLNRKKIKTYYVSRAYATRHGSGPFLHGLLKSSAANLKLKNNEEEINVKNDWQGEFRTAPINLDLLKHAVKVDRAYNDSEMNLCVTCMDQVDKTTIREIYTGFENRYESDTPTSDFKKC